MTKLEFLRRSEGWTQLDLSKRVGCHHTVISRLERGWQRRLFPGVEAALVKAFGGCSLEELLSEYKEPQA